MKRIFRVSYNSIASVSDTLASRCIDSQAGMLDNAVLKNGSFCPLAQPLRDDFLETYPVLLNFYSDLISKENGKARAKLRSKKS